MSLDNSLPLDLLQEILTRDPSLVKQGMELNKNVRGRLSPIVNELCKRPISENEVIDSLKSNSGVFAIFIKREPPFGDILNIYEEVGNYRYSKTQISFTHRGDSQLLLSKYGLGTTLMPYISAEIKKYEIFLDVYTIFDIFRQRRGCINIDPSYARKGTHAFFNRNINLINKNNLPEERLALYLYLMGNMQALGIDFTFINIHDMIVPLNTINRDIPTLTQIIDREIDSL